uniref:Plasmolipin n=1 Tax=Mola mola TaxID=94237 RepID=A0A3Q3WXC4_MOLML
MADFPSKVNTQTSSPKSHQTGSRLQGLAANVTTVIDLSFIQSIPAILMMVEIFLGLVHWGLIAATPYMKEPVYGWVMFVAITLWLLTITLFFLNLFSAQRYLPAVPWSKMVMVYHSVATGIYILAFLPNAITVNSFGSQSVQQHMAAAAFFGAIVAVAYGASAVMSYLHLRGDGGNAATSTVPT